MTITLNGTTGITTPDVNVTAQSSNIVTTGNVTAANATLSGGVYLGGTGSANLLDDYEEGTWTPTLTGQFTQASWDTVTSVTVSHARYTKIGELVTLIFAGKFNGGTTNLTTTSNICVGGLPFSPYGPGNSSGFNSDQGAGTFHVYEGLGSGLFATGSIMQYQGDITLTVTAQSGTVNSDSEVFFTYTYRTAS